jgi:hypothetical protein
MNRNILVSALFGAALLGGLMLLDTEAREPLQGAPAAGSLQFEAIDRILPQSTQCVIELHDPPSFYSAFKSMSFIDSSKISDSDMLDNVLKGLAHEFNITEATAAKLAMSLNDVAIAFGPKTTKDKDNVEKIRGVDFESTNSVFRFSSPDGVNELLKSERFKPTEDPKFKHQLYKLTHGVAYTKESGGGEPQCARLVPMILWPGSLNASCFFGAILSGSKKLRR